MKKILMWIIALYSLCVAQNAFAGQVMYFDVDFPADSVYIEEATDIRITALDANDNIVEDYEGSVLVFSQTDPEAQFSDDFEFGVYDFTLSDNGSAFIEGGITFNTLWNQDLYVYDLNDDSDSVMGENEILVKDEEMSESLDSLFSLVLEEDDGIEAISITAEVAETQELIETQKVNAKIISSFREKREYNTWITTSVSDVEEETEEETIQEKVTKMIVSSFRKVREYNTWVVVTVSQTEEETEEETIQEKVTKMIVSSFRKVREYNTWISWSSSQ